VSEEGGDQEVAALLRRCEHHTSARPELYAREVEEFDRDHRRLAEAYRQAPEASRRRLRKDIDPEISWNLIVFAHRAQQHALRERGLPWIEAALCGLSLAGHKHGDWRDTSWALSEVLKGVDEIGESRERVLARARATMDLAAAESIPDVRASPQRVARTCALVVGVGIIAALALAMSLYGCGHV